MGFQEKNKTAPQKLERTMNLVDDRYEVGVPWAEKIATNQIIHF